jgi:hypothetical protein
MDIKTVFDIVESGVKVAAIIIGASWTYWKFVIQRESEPATDLDIDVNFVGKQDTKWIIEITVTLENKSQARLKFEKNFQVTARYLLAGDKVEDGSETLKYQLSAPRTIDDRIRAERFFANVEYINPRQVFRQRYITYIPGDATFLWIQTKFFFHLKRRKEKVNSQRIFRVPEESLPKPTDAGTFSRGVG